METTVRQKAEKRFSFLPPFFIRLNECTLSLIEDFKPFLSREEVKQKINELRTEDVNLNNIYRFVKHQGRYFIYTNKS